MKALILTVLAQFPIFAMASFTQLNCTTISGGAVRIQFERSVDPQNPWIGFNTIGAHLQANEYHSNNIYKTDITISPLNPALDLNMRGDATQGGVYLQLYPQMTNGKATGHYTGQLFVNDLDQRFYLDFRSEGSEPGLVCK